MSGEADPQVPNENVLDYFNAKQTGGPRRAPSGLVLPLALLGATTLFVVSVTPTRTSGATRSSRLQWEHRSAEIDHAMTSSSSEQPHD